ncbi:MAG TPA: TIGR00730 family Rossman fold protein [Acidobacteriaceae bacterium]|nr:TIGR00730 family Rossman fold protein [Acidobacteriaceae bacterium]
MHTRQKNVAIFCGSAGGNHDQHLAVAREMGVALARRGYGTVYGGAQVGMMGALADAALAAGGQVIGVIPHVLEKVEITHRGLTELHIVPNMHERKALIASRSDAFIALPGGIGTFEEIFEAMTWAQLRIHAKPCLFLNSNGYYDKLLEFMDHVSAEGMFRGKNRGLMLVANSVDEALALVEDHWARHAAFPREAGLSLT